MLKKISQTKKWQLALYLLLLVAAIVAMVMLRNCGGDEGLVGAHSRVDKESGGDTIDVAIEYSPLSYYTYGDTLGGFNYEFMKLLGSTCGLKFKYHPIVSLQHALDGLKSGHYDVLAAQFPVTRENKEHYLFTSALYLDNQVLVQRNNDGLEITSQLDLAGDTVNIVKGSPMRERIMSLSREIGDTIYVVQDSVYGPEQLFLMVATGDIKYAVINESIAKKLASSHPNVDVSQAISFTQFQSLTLDKGSIELCDRLNECILKVKRMPQYNELLRKYFSQ
jgi:ABC-type amino acid transport substrate-binding protein